MRQHLGDPSAENTGTTEGSGGTWAAGMADRTDIERVREATDLVALIAEHIQLQPKGREWVGLCPFHDDQKPSMTVVTHREHAFYKCFSCGASGDCFTFMQEFLGLEFGEVLRTLADRAGITLSNRQVGDEEGPSRRSRMRRAIERAAGLYRDALSEGPQGVAVTAQLTDRGFSAESIEQFGLGFAPSGWDFLASRIASKPDAIEDCMAAGLVRQRDSGGHYDAFRNRIMFPILDESGSPIAFGGRRVDESDEPKYINSPETDLFQKSRTLYGMHAARRPIIEAKRAIVVEGYTDVIACHQAGQANVVGTLGTALTTMHAKRLSDICDEVILVFDGDEAGRRAADRAVEIFLQRPIDVRICVLPEGSDPADLAGDALDSHVNVAVDALSFKLARLDAAVEDTDTMSGRQKVLEHFIDELHRLGLGALDGLRRPLVLEHIGQLLDIDLTQVEQLVAQRAPAAQRPQQTEAPQDSRSVPRNRQLAEREFLSVMIYDPLETSAMLRERGDEIPCVEDFADEAARSIAAVALPRAVQGTSCRMQDLLDALPAEDARDLASRLYFDGQRICEATGGIAAAVTATLNALLAALRGEAMDARINQVRAIDDRQDRARAAQAALDDIRREKTAGSTS